MLRRFHSEKLLYIRNNLIIENEIFQKISLNIL